MSYNKIFVEHYGKVNDKRWSNSSTLIKNISTTVKTAIGSTKNTFSFKVINVNDEYTSLFNVNDKINIYATKNSDTYTSNNLIMNGVIKEVIKKIEGSTEIINIKGIDYSEVIMNAITFVSPTAPVNVMDILQEGINVVNDRSRAYSTQDSFYVGWNADNPTTKHNGDAFPLLYNIREYDVSMLSLLEKYLTPEYLDDDKYYWYINLDNELVIRKRLAETTLISGEKATLTEGQDIYSATIGIANDNVRNWIIWKAGFGPDGKSIQGFLQNSESINKQGIKPWILLLSTANDVIQYEKKENSNMSVGSLYPSTYPYTTSYKSSFDYSINKGLVDITATEGNSVTVDNDSEWNYAFDREVRWQGNSKAQRFLDLNSKGYLKVDLELPLTTIYEVGQVVEFTSQRNGLISKQLRINEINYSIHGTDLTLKEDEATI